MPKSYSESERQYIIKKLKEEAEFCLTQFGVKKTSVDELVKRANIPKGTFYLFYRSKELLFFDVFLEKHNEIQGNLLKSISSFESNVTAKQFSATIFEIYKQFEQSFLLQLTTNGDLEMIMRKLPEDVVSAHQNQDDFSFENIFMFIPQAKNKDIETFSGAFRAIFLMMLHKREIGEAVFENTLKLLIDGLIQQLFEAKNHEEIPQLQAHANEEEIK